MTMPTITELPPIPPDTSRDEEALLFLSLIPTDDPILRAKAIEYFRLSEREANTPGGPSITDHRKALREFCNFAARTPGGIAWKIATALNFWKDEEVWEWWRQMLNSALSDAIDLERVRLSRVSTGPDPAVFLADRWAELRQRHEELPDIIGDEESQEARSALCGDWTSICRTLAETPARSMAGVLAKLRVLESEVEAGRATDGHDLRLAKGITADLERLGVGGAS